MNSRSRNLSSFGFLSKVTKSLFLPMAMFLRISACGVRIRSVIVYPPRKKNFADEKKIFLRDIFDEKKAGAGEAARMAKIKNHLCYDK